MKRVLLILISLALPIMSYNVNISQIDSSKLLLNQSVDLYLQIKNDKGDVIKGLKLDDFKVSESASEDYFFNTQPLLGVEEGINSINGINFLLLIDNSGSMYRTIDGKDTELEDFWRITIAKDAIRNFVNNSVDVKDKIALASFNSNYKFHTDDIRRDGLSVLDSVIRPDEESNKTELYSSLTETLKNFSEIRGRKVVIVLSDGENVPVNPENPYSYTDTINEFLKEGVTIYGINYAGEADNNLVEITSSTGGDIFEAFKAARLKSIYGDIKNQILSEYKLSYRASMEPGNLRYLSVKVSDSTPVTRFYFSSSVFGVPKASFSPLFIILPLISIGILLLLWRLKFQKIISFANIEILQAAPGVTISDYTVNLSRGKTIIGGSQSADLTISSETTGDEEFATIVYDEDSKNYKVVSSDTILVNNQQTTEQVLETGDVINISGTTIVFDDDVIGKIESKSQK